MQQQLEARLQALKSEFEAGQKMLADLEAQQAQLHETLLRISGATQVLDEDSPGRMPLRARRTQGHLEA